MQSGKTVSADQQTSNLMKISIIICTHNRAESLRLTLKSIEKMNIPRNIFWKLIIVCNLCTDNTLDVLEEFQSSLPINTVIENNPGLSNARNAGIRNSEGKYIIWTDDDVNVDTNWLSAYCQLFRKDLDFAIFGGRSLPSFEVPEVSWFVRSSKYLKDLLAVRDFGKDDIPMNIKNGIMPFGLNFAISRNVQINFPYDPELGVAPGRRRGGEEVDVFERIMKSGYKGLWSPLPVVYHRIPNSRQSKKYIFEYYWSAGEQRAEFNRKNNKYVFLSRVPIRVLIKYVLLKAGVKFSAAFSKRWEIRFYASLSFCQGEIWRWKNPY